MQQYDSELFFHPDLPRALIIPQPIMYQLSRGAAVAISISGGKDSQALIKAVTLAVRSLGFNNYIFGIHADLGRVEWPQSLSTCETLCKEFELDFRVVKREKGDLLDRWQERMMKLAGTNKPFWSSSAARYCTSDMKRGPINKELRKFNRVISVEGIRAEESDAREEKPVFEIRKAIHNSKRIAYTWNAILDWSLEQVLGTYGHTLKDLQLAREFYNDTGFILPDWKFHPAYAMGNNRVSCMFCVLGCNNDLENGMRHNPALGDTLIEMEDQSGFTFKKGKSLKSIKEKIQNEH